MSKTAPAVVQLALLVVVARSGDLRAVGLLAIASALAFGCASIAEAGFGTSFAVSRVAFGADRPPLRATRRVRLTAASLGSAAFLLAWAAGIGEREEALLIATPLPFLLALAYGYAGALNAAGRLAAEGRIAVAESVVILAVAIAAIEWTGPLEGALIALVVGRLAGTMARGLLVDRLRGDVSGSVDGWRIQRPYLAATVVIVAHGQADILVLGTVASPELVGTYAPLLRLAYASLLVAEAASWALFGAAGDRGDESAAPARRFGSSGQFFVAGVAFGVAFLVLYRPVFGLVLDQPAPPVAAAALLAAAIPIRFLSFSSTVRLVRGGWQLARIPVLLTALVILLGGSVLASKNGSLSGLALSRFASEVVIAAGYAVLAAKLAARRPPRPVVSAS
ncbi:MAG: hypothetical protein WD825_17590 [Gemmatimonadaceae bacterium]